jgi:hypothetical protein
MRRALLGTCIGAVCGVLTLAGIGAQAGFTYGGLWVFGRKLPPGWGAAGLGAFVYTAYYWWLAGIIGAIFGGLTGLGSWSVRPRPAGKNLTAR